MPRLAPLLVAALCVSLSPLSASAVSALFDFDDFPYNDDVGWQSPGWSEPYTFLYGCDGKDHCTGEEVWNTNTNDAIGVDTVSATRNGITMELTRQNIFDVNYERHGRLSTGDDPEDFNLFLFDFDTPLRSFSARITGPTVVGEECDDNDVCTDVYSLVKLYLWSESGGQGTLVGSLTLTPDEIVGDQFVTVALVTDQPFRSGNFGHASPADPDCIVSPFPRPCGTEGIYFNNHVIDDILVSTVPEPATAALLMLGLTGLAAARRAHPIV